MNLGTLRDLARLTYVRATGRATRDFVVTTSGPATRDAAALLLALHSELSGQVHALSDDPWSFLWTETGDAFLPFHEMPSSVIAWRDPVGRKPAREGMLRRFRAYAAAHGKHALVLGSSADCATQAAGMGFESTRVGSEAFFDLKEWHARGKRGEKLRLAVNHARRELCRAEEFFPLEDRAARSEMQSVEREWKAARAERLNPSFLRTAPMEHAASRRYFGTYAEGNGGRSLHAFLVCSRVGTSGWYLQDLVRAPSAPRGATELVSLAALETFREEGVAFATMGIVPSPQSGGVVSEWLLGHLDRAYRFSGLQQFRKKFAPSRWESVHVCHWPLLLTPWVAWDLARLVAPSATPPVMVALRAR